MAADCYTTSAFESFCSVLDVPADVATRYVEDAEAAVEQISLSATATSARYPDFFRMSDTSLTFLYAAILRLRPSAVVETGVADGSSTRVILSALEAVNHGHLYSFDIDPLCSEIVIPNRDRWTLTVLDQAGDPPRELARRLQQIAKTTEISVFLHDSDHSYTNHSLELDAFLKVSSGEQVLICSDDLHHSPAWRKWAKQNGLKFSVLASVATYPKFFGATLIEK